MTHTSVVMTRGLGKYKLKKRKIKTIFFLNKQTHFLY